MTAVAPSLLPSKQFRFDAATHTYVDLVTGAECPHITGMLEQTGWTDSAWFTEEASDRGTAVHIWTARYDLGACDPHVDLDAGEDVRGYLLAHVDAMKTLRPTWHAIEEARLHPTLKYSGRPDRVGELFGGLAVLEVKSGGPARSHQIQTALQTILVANDSVVPAESWQRYALYLRPNGSYGLEQHKDKRDFQEARRIIQRCCR